MRNASRAEPGALPKSLMRRLALLELGLRPVSAPRARARMRVPSAKARKRRIGAYFGLGLAGGGVLGCAALLILLVHPEQTRTRPALVLSDGAALPTMPPQETVRTAAAATPSASLPDAPIAAAAARAVPQLPILEAPFRTEVIAAPSPLPAVEDAAKASWPAEVRAEAGAPPQRPAGLSALGGPQGDLPATTTQVGRTLWWKMPVPAWTPFDRGLSPN